MVLIREQTPNVPNEQPGPGLDDNSDDEDDDSDRPCRDKLRLQLFSILVNMEPVPESHWMPVSEQGCCQHCERKVWRYARLYSHCRRCGMLLCTACNRNRFCFPFMRNKPQKVCPTCHESLVRLDAALDTVLDELRCTREDLYRMLAAELRKANLGQVSNDVFELNASDYIRHPASELIKSAVCGTEAGLSRAAPQALITTGSTASAAVGSVIVATVVQTVASVIEIRRLYKRRQRGKLDIEAYRWAVAAETSKGVFAVGGAVAGATIGSIIPGIGTALGIVVGAALGCVASFVLSVGARAIVCALGEHVRRDAVVSRPNESFVCALSNGIEVSVQFIAVQAAFLSANLNIRPLQIAIPHNVELLQRALQASGGRPHWVSKRQARRACRRISQHAALASVRLQELVDWRKLSPSTVCESASALEDAYGRLVFSYVCDVYRPCDEALEQRIRELRQPKALLVRLGNMAPVDRANYLAVKTAFERPNGEGSRCRSHVKQCLERFSESHSSTEKLQCLEEIVKCIDAFLGSADMSNGTSLTDALEYFIIEVFQPRCLLSSIQYMQKCLPNPDLGMPAYLVTNLESAVMSILSPTEAKTKQAKANRKSRLAHSAKKVKNCYKRRSQKLANGFTL